MLGTRHKTSTTTFMEARSLPRLVLTNIPIPPLFLFALPLHSGPRQPFSGASMLFLASRR